MKEHQTLNLAVQMLPVLPKLESPNTEPYNLQTNDIPQSTPASFHTAGFQ